MTVAIDRAELQRLVAEEDAQIVDVLPEREYTESHLPGAISLPLRCLDARAATELQRDKPVVVY
ncbi:MAG: rhodanese-like domain-containing protein [Acidimicrobiia bacterium]